VCRFDKEFMDVAMRINPQDKEGSTNATQFKNG
jgi:hypothetical protein